jgi:hypothetical protein
MNLANAPTSGIEAEIKKFQRAQRRAHADGALALADDIGGKLLAPLFAEMARRQRAGMLA